MLNQRNQNKNNEKRRGREKIKTKRSSKQSKLIQIKLSRRISFGSMINDFSEEKIKEQLSLIDLKLLNFQELMSQQKAVPPPEFKKQDSSRLSIATTDTLSNYDELKDVEKQNNFHKKKIKKIKKQIQTVDRLIEIFDLV